MGKAGGFSLIELMVSIVLGMIILAGATSIYLASKRSMTEGEQVAAVSENGRFALQLLNTAVRHVGFFGGSNPADIREDGSLGAVTACTDEASAYDTSQSLYAVNTTTAVVFSNNCIDDALPDTDVLVIKGVAPSPLFDADPDDPSATRDGVISFPTGLNAEDVYVIANSESGILLDGADTAPSVSVGTEFAQGVAWPYRMQIYYIRQPAGGGAPMLSRKVLQWDSTAGAMAVQTQDLVQGVENIHYLFSYDSDGDGEVDALGDADAVDIAGAWNLVMSLQVFMLVRSDVADPNYTDEKTYNLGDIPFTPSGDERNFRRILLNTDIAMRNPRLVLRGGA
ncbi:MAG: PilW family protein [Pseudomonadales bacterium]|nr:PilW family protein [Pseudomonadales bacterium]MCP5188614.1 PilW family protein [Pseudomonadales bacterium]